MIRGVLGVVLTLVALAPLGSGILILTGSWARVGGVLRWGVVVFTGMAAAILLLPPLLYAGLSPSIPIVLVLGVVALAAGLVVESRRQRPTRPEAVRLGLGPAIVLAIPLALLAAEGVRKPVDGFDAMGNWSLKAKLLAAGGTFTGALDDRAFAIDTAASPANRQYPIGLPALEAVFFDGMGGANTRVAHLLFVALLAGFALMVWALLRPRVETLPLTAGLSFLLWMPAVRDQILIDYADVPLACLYAVTVLGVGLWLAGDGGDRLALGSLFAAAALATKQDALAFCAVLFGLAFLAVLVRRERSRLRPLLVAFVVVFVSALPWRIFIAANGLDDSGVGFSPSRARDQAGELPLVLDRFLDLFLRPAYFGAVPLAALAALLLLVRGRDRQLAAGSLLLGLGLVAALSLVYLSGIGAMQYLLNTSAHRTLMTVTVVAAVLLPVLVPRALATFVSEEAPAERQG